MLRESSSRVRSSNQQPSRLVIIIIRSPCLGPRPSTRLSRQVFLFIMGSGDTTLAGISQWNIALIRGLADSPQFLTQTITIQ